MSITATIFWLLGLILSVTIAPQLRIWTWGPAMLCFSVATLLVIPNLWRGGIHQLNRFILFTGLATAAWIATRAWFSPVHELALADLLLLTMAISTFVVVQNAFRDSASQKIIIAGIACLLVGQLAIMAVQMANPEYSLLFPDRDRGSPAGFYGHYSHAASFLIVSSLLLMGFGLRGSIHISARFFLILLSLLGLAAVFVTKSRAGLIGAGGGLFTLLMYWILAAKRDGKKWGFVALIITPIIFLALTIVFGSLLSDVEQIRNKGSDLLGMVDNSLRLYYLGIAVSCIALHPLLGGGSRSFSWESFQFWDVESMGRAFTKPEHVHNEFVQTIADYGIIGAGLLLLLLVSIVITCTLKSVLKNQSTAIPSADAWRIGGIAAFVGFFIQTNFEGILRTPPGAVLLAICLAAASHGLSSTSFSSSLTKPIRFRNSLLVAFSLLAVAMLGFFGWKGTLVSTELWQPYFSKKPISMEAKISPFSRALDHWKLHSIHQERAMLYHNLANQNSNPKEYENLLQLAVKDYSEASSLHPFDPTNPLNEGRALSSLGLADQASACFEKAIQLQGEMEANFHSYYYYSDHLYRTGVAAFAAGELEAASAYLELAAVHVEKANDLGSSWLMEPQFSTLRAYIYIDLGQTFEKAGNFEKAMEQFDHAATLPYGNPANYFAATMLGRRADALWLELRQSEALRLYKEAEKRAHQSSQLPPAVTTEKRDEWISHLSKSIQLLERAGYEPSE